MSPLLFGDAIRGPLAELACFRDPGSWSAWEAWDRAILGAPLDAEQLPRFQRHTGRSEPRAGGYVEAVAIKARRSGGTTYCGTRLALDAAAVEDGRGLFYVVLAQDARSALRAAFAPVQRVFSTAAFRELVARETQDSIELTTGATLAVYPARPAAVRGLTLGGAFLDELAFIITSEGKAADKELLRAVRPALATTGGRLYIASSPFAQSGALWELFKRHHGEGIVSKLLGQSSTVVLKASAPEMNPSLPADYLERMKLEDPEAYQSEVLGEFRAGVGALFDSEALAAVVDHGRREAAPVPGVRYVAHFDGAGGSGGGDSAALAIGHVEDGVAVVDLVRSWAPPFDPEAVAREVSETLRSYRLRSVKIDGWAKDLQRVTFRRYQITAEDAERDTSARHLALLGPVNSGRVRLPDSERLLSELRGLIRRASGGTEKATHLGGHHDDLAAAVAGVVYQLATKPKRDLGITLSAGGDSIGTGRPESRPEAKAAEVRVNVPSPASDPVRYREWSRAKAAGEDVSRFEHRVRRVPVRGGYIEVSEDSE